MNIKRVAASDKRLRALDAELFGADYAPTWTGQWWLVLCAGRAVAYAGARLWTPDNCVFLSRCGVLPEVRGCGLQRRLIRVRERWAREQGALGLYTYTARTGIHSANNLIREGYELWNPERKWGLSDGLYFWKGLEK